MAMNTKLVEQKEYIEREEAKWEHEGEKQTDLSHQLEVSKLSHHELMLKYKVETVTNSELQDEIKQLMSDLDGTNAELEDQRARNNVQQNEFEALQRDLLNMEKEKEQLRQSFDSKQENEIERKQRDRPQRFSKLRTEQDKSPLKTESCLFDVIRTNNFEKHVHNDESTKDDTLKEKNVDDTASASCASSIGDATSSEMTKVESDHEQEHSSTTSTLDVDPRKSVAALAMSMREIERKQRARSQRWKSFKAKRDLFQRETLTNDKKWATTFKTMREEKESININIERRNKQSFRTRGVQTRNILGSMNSGIQIDAKERSRNMLRMILIMKLDKLLKQKRRLKALLNHNQVLEKCCDRRESDECNRQID